MSSVSIPGSQLTSDSPAFMLGSQPAPDDTSRRLSIEEQSHPMRTRSIDKKYDKAMPGDGSAEVVGRPLKELFAERVASMQELNDPDACKAFWEGRSEYDNLSNLVTTFSGETHIEVQKGREWFLEKLRFYNRLADENKNRATTQKLSGHFGAFPLVLQNPPNKRRVEQINGMEIKALRHPAPTSSYKENHWLKDYKSFIAIIKGIFHAIFQSKQYVMPSFKSYVEKLDKEKTDYLYVNFQSIKKKGKGDVEHKRTKALKEFGEEHSNFYFFSQVMDGSFFKRAPRVKSMNELTTHLQRELMNGVHGHIDCKKLGISKEQCQKQIGKSVQLTQELFFKDIEDVKNNWTAFLLIFYTLQRLDWKAQLAAKTSDRSLVYLTACKDFQDRGNFCAALLDEILLATLSGKIGPNLKEEDFPKEEKFLKDLIIHTVGVPLRSKGQGIISSRLEQGSGALNRLLTLKIGQIELIKKAYSLNPTSLDITMDGPQQMTPPPSLMQ